MFPLLFDKCGGGALEDRILRHAELYGLTTPHVVERLFIHSQDSISHQTSLENATELLLELSDRRRLARLEGADTGSEESFERNAFVYPGHELRTGDDLARLWFCCMGGKRRHAIEYREMIEQFNAEGIGDRDGPHHNFFHALAQEEGGPVLYRLYICRAERKNAREQMRNIIGKNARPFRYWIDQGSYGVAVLVQSPQKQHEIEQLLQKSYGGRPTLHQQARFIVSVVPTEADYGMAIKKYEHEAWESNA